MALEIEWRFLVTKYPGIPAGCQSVGMLQTYLTTGSPTVRVRVVGEEGRITVKSVGTVPEGGGPVARHEYEYAIPVEDARKMTELTDHRIEKRRYYLPGNLEVDVFAGRHAGLVLAEVEVEEHGPPPQPPAGWEWIDVSADWRYSNQALAVEGLPPACVLAEETKPC
ncbi:MAG: adenylate cyclase [Candidatus Sumerlaeota bacterium]|nr:adenylate cyclase [Candidatus Sumerlaeota bacterium]